MKEEIRKKAEALWIQDRTDNEMVIELSVETLEDFGIECAKMALEDVAKFVADMRGKGMNEYVICVDAAERVREKAKELSE